MSNSSKKTLKPLRIAQGREGRPDLLVYADLGPIRLRWFWYDVRDLTSAETEKFLASGKKLFG